jgi:hypothetical protein
MLIVAEIEENSKNLFDDVKGPYNGEQMSKGIQE